jgi:hypothetical protein
MTQKWLFCQWLIRVIMIIIIMISWKIIAPKYSSTFLEPSSFAADEHKFLSTRMYYNTWLYLCTCIYYFTGAVSISYAMVSNGRTIFEWWIRKDAEGNGHGIIVGNLQAFSRRDRGKPQKILGKIVGVLAVTRTGNFQNSIHKRGRLNQLSPWLLAFGSCF